MQLLTKHLQRFYSSFQQIKRNFANETTAYAARLHYTDTLHEQTVNTIVSIIIHIVLSY